MIITSIICLHNMISKKTRTYACLTVFHSSSELEPRCSLLHITFLLFEIHFSHETFDKKKIGTKKF